MIQFELEGGNQPQKKPTGLLINNDVLFRNLFRFDLVKFQHIQRQKNGQVI